MMLSPYWRVICSVECRAVSRSLEIPTGASEMSLSPEVIDRIRRRTAPLERPEPEMPRVEPNLIFEFACHESNIGVSGILAGARADEKRAAEAKTGSK